MSNKNQAFIVEGGHKLSGEIVPQGAKNEALQDYLRCFANIRQSNHFQFARH